MRKVIAAYFDRVLEFDTQKEAEKYLEALRKNSEFRILHHKETGGKYRLKIRKQYHDESPVARG